MSAGEAGSFWDGEKGEVGNTSLWWLPVWIKMIVIEANEYTKAASPSTVSMVVTAARISAGVMTGLTG